MNLMFSSVSQNPAPLLVVLLTLSVSAKLQWIHKIATLRPDMDLYARLYLEILIEILLVPFQK